MKRYALGCLFVECSEEESVGRIGSEFLFLAVIAERLSAICVLCVSRAQDERGGQLDAVSVSARLGIGGRHGRRLTIQSGWTFETQDAGPASKLFTLVEIQYLRFGYGAVFILTIPYALCARVSFRLTERQGERRVKCRDLEDFGES